MSEEIKRAVGLLVIEAVNSNPNGDPDQESDPRQRDDGFGEISPVSFKRKLRDLVENHDTPFFRQLPEKFSKKPDHYSILEHRGRSRDEIKKEMGNDPSNFLSSRFVEKYWDARVFGNTFLEKEGDKGFIKTGVVQFGMGVSLAPVEIIRQTNTNKAGVQEGKNAGMAPLGYRVVVHGVYCMPFFVNPNFAAKTGCSADDIELLKLLIPDAYDLNRSAIRPDVRIRHAWYVEHKNLLGSCPDYKIIEALTPVKKGNADQASRSWQDYEDRCGLPDELLQRVASCRDLMDR
jgi:CRISPR-associated protein Csd2